MNTIRETAYRIDPVLWVREILGVTPATLAGDIFASATRGIHSCADRATGWQDHHRGMGDCAFHAFYARIVVCDWLSGATPKCGSRAPGARRLSSRRALNSRATMSSGWSSRTDHASWRCRAAMIRSVD